MTVSLHQGIEIALMVVVAVFVAVCFVDLFDAIGLRRDPSAFLMAGAITVGFFAGVVAFKQDTEQLVTGAAAATAVALALYFIVSFLRVLLRRPQPFELNRRG